MYTLSQQRTLREKILLKLHTVRSLRLTCAPLSYGLVTFTRVRPDKSKNLLRSYLSVFFGIRFDTRLRV